jgi:hypothetical protein
VTLNRLSRASTCVIVLAIMLGCGNGSNGGNTQVNDTSGGTSVVVSGGGTTAGGAGGGGAAAGGSSSHTGGTSSPTTLTKLLDASQLTEYEACVLSYQAVCQRMYGDCGYKVQSVQSCLDNSVRDCPDALFGNGSQITIADLVDCIPHWQQASCDDLAKGNNPVCGFSAGTKAVGEPCNSYAQCASMSCSEYAGSDSCGTCLPRAKLGEPCNGEIACASGSSCNGTVCAAPLAWGLAPGSSCQYYGQCTSGYTCLNGTCQPQVAVGAACSSHEDCFGFTYCSSKGVCTNPPGLGQACPEGYCASGSYCDSSSSNHVCSAFLAIGQTCTMGSGALCGANLHCDCVDSTCSARACMTELQESQACGAPNTQCTPGTQCQNSVCVGVASQGLYAKVCGN